MEEMNADRQRLVELAQAAPASRDALLASLDPDASGAWTAWERAQRVVQLTLAKLT